MTDDELAGFDAQYGAETPPEIEAPLDEETPPETPVDAHPAAPAFDEDALIEKLVARLGQSQAAAQPAAPVKQDGPPPSWDDFEGSLDEFVAAHVAYATKGAAQTSMVAMQESQTLAALAPQLPAEVSQIASQWLNQLPAEHLQPGVANTIVAHVLGQYQLNQITKGAKGSPSAPKAVADSGVPNAGFTSPEESQMRASLQAAFPHLSAKDIQEIIKNGN